MKNTQDKNLTQILESEQKELKVVWEDRNGSAGNHQAKEWD